MRPADSGRYPSGQRGQTVNLLAYAFGGSNPPLPTIVAGALSPDQTGGGLRRARLREARAVRCCAKARLRAARAVTRCAEARLRAAHAATRCVVPRLRAARAVLLLREVSVAPRLRRAHVALQSGGNSSAVERQPSKLGVAGSNPVSRSRSRVCAHVAQSAERVLGKDEVSGSIPDMGSRIHRRSSAGGVRAPRRPAARTALTIIATANGRA